jgi:ankyrin repeat protein
MVQVLLEYGVDIDTKNIGGRSPLASALRCGHPNGPGVARLLIEHGGADPNTRDMDGFTPLHHASGGGKTETVRFLIEHGANVEVTDDEGRTPLDVALGKQHEDIIKLLLEHLAKTVPCSTSSSLFYE